MIKIANLASSRCVTKKDSYREAEWITVNQYWSEAMVHSLLISSKGMVRGKDAMRHYALIADLLFFHYCSLLLSILSSWSLIVNNKISWCWNAMRENSNIMLKRFPLSLSIPCTLLPDATGDILNRGRGVSWIVWHQHA